MNRTTCTEYGLGRRKAVDPRDANFRIRRLPPDLTPRTRRWRRGPTLDQGALPHCVEFAAKHLLMSQPLMHNANVVNRLLDGLYEQAQRNDEWPGEDYDGTSGRGAMKSLQARGLIGEYHWITTESMLSKYVRAVSPVMVGTSWLTEMFTPTSDGYLQVQGGEEGGHEWLALWYEESKARYVCQNSWGPDWGRDGLFYLHKEDMRILLEDLGGDAVTAVEVKISREVI